MTEELYLRFAALLSAALLVPAITFGMFALVHREMRFWRYAGAGLLCLFFASALSAARDALPAAFFIFASNALVGMGYFLTVKSLRSAYLCQRWQRLDVIILTTYLGAAVLVNYFLNLYEARVILVSSVIMIFSVLAGLVLYFSDNIPSRIATGMLLGFSVFNAAFTAARLVAALPNTDSVLSLAFWDPVFFIWSIAATFLFALAQFINGNAFIKQEHLQALQETEYRLCRERALSHELARSKEEQNKLQKLLLHEFKRPLSTLHATLQVSDVTKTAVDAKKLDQLRALTKQANRYLEGIGQYQDISELFEDPNWDLIPVSEIAQDISTKWGVKVVIDDQLESQALPCDPLLLDIAISNLVENAIKFGRTAAGISVLLDRTDDTLRLDVQDDGPGVPTAEWARIWQKFYKLDKETPHALTGCGLGLHIVDEVAKAHNGRAYVVSHAPSVIRLELPLRERASADE